jgi:hypothetical protein
MTHPSLTFIARRIKFIASKFALCKLYDGYYRKILFANFMMPTTEKYSLQTFGWLLPKDTF